MFGINREYIFLYILGNYNGERSEFKRSVCYAITAWTRCTEVGKTTYETNNRLTVADLSAYQNDPDLVRLLDYHGTKNIEINIEEENGNYPLAVLGDPRWSLNDSLVIVPKCECCGGRGWDAFALPDFPATKGFLDIEKCDECGLFQWDEDAVQAARLAGIHCFAMGRETGECIEESDLDQADYANIIHVVSEEEWRNVQETNR